MRGHSPAPKAPAGLSSRGWQGQFSPAIPRAGEVGPIPRAQAGRAGGGRNPQDRRRCASQDLVLHAVASSALVQRLV